MCLQNRKVDSGSDPVVWHSFGERPESSTVIQHCKDEPTPPKSSHKCVSNAVPTIAGCPCAGITHIVRPEDYPVMPVEHVRMLSNSQLLWIADCLHTP